jgi:hypothetical protein
MPQPPTANSNSSPQSAFTPRKEFIREQKPPPNSFALLAIAGSGFIRLYSFPLQVIDAFRHIFQQRAILVGFRENVSQNLYEFSLDGKPWASAKSVATEKLLIDLVAIVYQCGYVYLSTLDYGREHDDRLVMAFSKPEIQHAHSRSGTPLPTSPWLNGSAFQSCDKPRSKRLPFALSFTSGTTMRVIAPPLNLTPAILQAVRNSWPRGVVSEKKVGDNSFEFKLKGYKCAILIRLCYFSVIDTPSRVSTGYLSNGLSMSYSRAPLIFRCAVIYPPFFDLPDKSLPCQGLVDIYGPSFSRGFILPRLPSVFNS